VGMVTDFPCCSISQISTLISTHYYVTDDVALLKPEPFTQYDGAWNYNVKHFALNLPCWPCKGL